MSKTAGYSGTPLIKKLGIKPGQQIAFINSPANYHNLLGTLPTDLLISNKLSAKLDFIHYFQKQRSQLEGDFPQLKAALNFDGMLWISWPKRASKVETDISDSIVREIGLGNGLVDVKVAAVDSIWSGLKFVYRLEDRPVAK